MSRKQNTTTTTTQITQHPDKRLMERIRALERNEHIKSNLVRMKHNGYTDKQCKTWLIKIAVLSDFMDVFDKIIVD